MLNGPWPALVFGLLLVAGSIKTLPEGSNYRGFPYPAWGVAILLLVGLCITFISLRAIIRGEGKVKKPPYTEEEIARAKAVLEKIHQNDYGVPPDYPDEGKDGKSDSPDTKRNS